jgi:hypothetical protein
VLEPLAHRGFVGSEGIEPAASGLDAKVVGTGYSLYGVIALDNTLVDHAGKLNEDVGYFWDHADERYKLAHDYLISNYVCSPSRLHYPLDFHQYRKREEYAKGETYQTHDMLFQELVTWAVAEGFPGDFTFDCYFSSAANMNFIQVKGRNYVADLKFNRQVWFKGEELKASTVAACIPPDDRKPCPRRKAGNGISPRAFACGKWTTPCGY